MWHLSENGEPHGQFDVIIIACNGDTVLLPLLSLSVEIYCLKILHEENACFCLLQWQNVKIGLAIGEKKKKRKQKKIFSFTFHHYPGSRSGKDSSFVQQCRESLCKSKPL